MGARLRKTAKIPGFKRLFVKMWGPISKKMFGPDAGFGNVFYPKEKGAYRMDITKCPYNSYFTELGTPELTKIFCINDECTYGDIPYGIHTIRIVRFDPDRISSREGNEHVPVWNHDITMVRLDDNHTKYTDRVEILAGWKTVFVWLWAKLFYAHRQKKWIRLLEKTSPAR